MSRLQVLGIKKLVAFAEKHHELVLAGTDAQSKITRFETTARCTLPVDLKQFYLACESVEIGAVEILPIDNVRAVQTIYDESMQDQFCSTWFAFGSLHDATFVAFDASTHEGNNCILYIDPYAGMGEQIVIALSFSHFLSNLLLADGDPFWLDPSFEYEPLGILGANQ